VLFDNPLEAGSEPADSLWFHALRALPAFKSSKKRRSGRKANRPRGLAAPEGLAQAWRTPAHKNRLTQKRLRGAMPTLNLLLDRELS